MIGFEIHEQINTPTKLFCDCPTTYREVEPNTNICEVCTGMPGSKPFPVNQYAIDAAIEIAMMLNCEIIKDPVYIQRKHYNYPDLPSGYQRTSLPIGKNGNLLGVGIWEVHLEEDPGKYDPVTGKVDYNRSGVPLVEIVTAPEIYSAKDGRNFMRELVKVLSYTGKVRTEGGTMRMDTNISLEGGRRVEIKNINSIRGAYKALNFEITRQKNLMKRGKSVKQETRAFLESQMITKAMRAKEEADDYRYIPDPDIPPLLVFDEKIESIRAIMQEAPHLKEERFAHDYGVKADDANILASELELANAFEKIAKEVDPKFAANWIRDELKRVLLYNKKTFKESGIRHKHIVGLLKMMQRGEITAKTGQKVIEIMGEKPGDPQKIVEELGMGKITKNDVLETAVDEAIKENKKAANEYLGGKGEALNFVVGAVMRKTKGRADPATILKMLKERLEK
ncbi:Asp-tRNA(Asn)/Glu-tRNA(Gln) amidotransferase subunit GatB [archaeon]|nr:Asp-tRNA(Asn)/Glu-tRNA(Gln) amidotransferase subunit GatB [archaeon]